MTKKISTIIFDGDCGICQKLRKIVKRLDWLQQLDCRPLQESDLYREFPFLSPSICQKEITFITKNGRVYGGGRAIVEIGLRLPITALWVWPFLFPPLKHFANRAYSKVANGRYKMSNSCGIDQKNQH